MVFAGLLAGGCIHLKQEIEIRKGNTGRFSMAMSVPDSVYAGLMQGKHKRLEPVRKLFVKEAGAAMFPANAGFRIFRYRVYTDEGRHHVVIEGKLVDAKKALASGRLGNFQFEPKEGGGGRLQLTLTHPLKGSGTAAAVISDTVKDEMRAAAAGIRIELTIKVPKKITRAGTKDTGKRVARWVFDPAQDDAFLFTAPDISLEWE